MNYTERTYFTMLTVYHQVSQSGTPIQLSKVLLALEDFERNYYNVYGLGALMELMDKAEKRKLFVH